MEVRGQQPGGADEARARFRRTQAEVAAKNSERVAEARERLEALSAERHRQATERREAAEAEAAERATEIVRQGTEEARADVGRAAEGGRSGAAKESVDRIELSSGAQGVVDLERAEAQREARVEALRKAYEAGDLSTPERVERAATRLLSGAQPDRA